ncbi:MAG TPA: O-methyltransferase [Methylothermaceae bacterium]|nr:O-methyltransferase [Methylothermaceae bacterium]
MTDLHKPRVSPTVLAPVAPEIEGYLHRLSDPRHDHPVLREMEQRAMENDFPIVGRLVGAFLKQLASMIGARRVFEFGSGYGYSAWWFAQAVSDAGMVVCSDADPANRDLAEDYLGRAGLGSRVDFRIGLAQEVFRQVEGDFDICYNDVDKGDYPQVWRLARGRIRPGGLYIADNALWYGRVALDEFVDVVPGWTEAVREHNRLIFSDPDFEAFINPVRDGVLVARRVR